MPDVISAKNAYYATKRFAAAVWEANADAALMHDAYRTPETESAAATADAAAFFATVALKHTKRKLLKAKEKARRRGKE